MSQSAAFCLAQYEVQDLRADCCGHSKECVRWLWWWSYQRMCSDGYGDGHTKQCVQMVMFTRKIHASLHFGARRFIFAILIGQVDTLLINSFNRILFQKTFSIFIIFIVRFIINKRQWVFHKLFPYHFIQPKAKILVLLNSPAIS